MIVHKLYWRYIIIPSNYTLYAYVPCKYYDFFLIYVLFNRRSGRDRMGERYERTIRVQRQWRCTLYLPHHIIRNGLLDVSTIILLYYHHYNISAMIDGLIFAVFFFCTIFSKTLEMIRPVWHLLTSVRAPIIWIIRRPKPYWNYYNSSRLWRLFKLLHTILTFICISFYYFDRKT